MAIRDSASTVKRVTFSEAWRRIKKYPIVPLILLSPVIICGLFGPFFYPHDPTIPNMSADAALKPPAWITGDWSYALGTDRFGRDLLSRIIQGARASLIVSFVGVFFAGLIGVTLGMTAGYFKGKIDNIIMRLVDAWMSIPYVLFMILMAAILGGGIGTIIISISLVFWTSYARVVRGETISIREHDFILRAKVTGCSNFRILIRHILPNLTNTIMVMATLQLGSAIMVEASLTFLGLGIQPPNTAWGLIISDGRAYLATAWWIPTFAGIAISITVLGANLFGDWLRDALDPRTRKSLN